MRVEVTGDAVPSTRGILRFADWLVPEIIAFQREAYPHRRPDWIDPRWRWMFLDSAARLGVPPMVWVYRNKDGVVAHQGGIAVAVRIGDLERVTGWFVETMALERVRGKAVGPMLIKKALEDLPFNLSLGQTPNMRAIQFSLGWEQVCPLNSYAFILNGRAVVQGKLPAKMLEPAAGIVLDLLQRVRSLPARASLRQEQEMHEIHRFDGSHDDLWQRVCEAFPCAVARDASYLNWKYVEQPGQTFHRIETRQAGRVTGVIVVTTREPDDVYRYRRGFIVDIVVAPDDEPVWGLLDAARRRLRQLGAAMILLDVANPRLERAARRFGFSARLAERVFLLATGDLPDPAAALARTGENWLVTMGDSDIDRPW